MPPPSSLSHHEGGIFQVNLLASFSYTLELMTSRSVPDLGPHAGAGLSKRRRVFGR